MAKQQICIACNRLVSLGDIQEKDTSQNVDVKVQQPLSQSSCLCGHVMKEAVSLSKETGRKRKITQRLNSISLDDIDINFETTKKIRDDECQNVKQRKDRKFKTNARKQDGRKMRNKLHKTNEIESEDRKAYNSFDKQKQDQVQEILNLIETSYKNIYFNQSKSYKKVKISDFNFEFDFSTFESHNPYYPTALEDINTKISRTNTFKIIVNST